MTVEVTAAAERDIRRILAETLQSFGPIQFERYTDIIERGIELIGEDPTRAGAVDRFDIAPGVKLFHLELAARRRGGASRCLYYTVGPIHAGEVGAILLRVLHERMEPRRRVLRSLSEQSGRS